MTGRINGMGGVEYYQTDADLMRFIAEQEINGIATTTLVEVVAVNGDRVDVTPLVKQVDGAGNGIDHATIHDLPVHAMRAGPAVIRIVPRVGDIGAALFCHSDISSVKVTKQASVPGSNRRYDWSDGLYLGGFLPRTEATSIIEIDADDNVNIVAPAVNVEVTDRVNISGKVNTDSEYLVDGTRVLTSRGSAIAAPTGGSTVDAQARTAIDQIRAELARHGLIA